MADIKFKLNLYSGSISTSGVSISAGTVDLAEGDLEVWIIQTATTGGGIKYALDSSFDGINWFINAGTLGTITANEEMGYVLSSSSVAFGRYVRVAFYPQSSGTAFSVIDIIKRDT